MNEPKTKLDALQLLGSYATGLITKPQALTRFEHMLLAEEQGAATYILIVQCIEAVCVLTEEQKKQAIEEARALSTPPGPSGLN